MILKYWIIKYLPPVVINKLRILKYYIDYFKGFLYKIGIKIDNYRPFYLRFFYNNQKTNGLKFNNKYDSWGYAFNEYLIGKKPTINLVWAGTPIPGNYGDWLSPYIISKITNRSLKFNSEIFSLNTPHIIALGSILSFANKNSFVIGSGIASLNEILDLKAKIYSVRGQYSANLLNRKDITQGDIGFIISDVYKVFKKNSNKNVLLVRHLNHRNIPLELNGICDEFSIEAARAKDIELFIDKLHKYKLVVTSAMHCFITCISYEIPVILVDFINKTNSVPGDGIKYLDALSGADLPEVKPIKINNLDDLINCIKFVKPYEYKLKNEKRIEIKNTIIKTINDYDSTVKFKDELNKKNSNTVGKFTLSILLSLFLVVFK